MVSVFDHLILWGAFFITGIILGITLTYFLMQASKLRY